MIICLTFIKLKRSSVSCRKPPRKLDNIINDSDIFKPVAAVEAVAAVAACF